MITSDKILDLYDGDGATTSFPITIEHTGVDDVKVELVEKETGLYTELDEGVDWIYSVAGEAISCETVIAPSSDFQLMISLDLPFTQEAEWIQDGPFAHNVLNRALDKLTLLAKQLKGIIGGALHAPIEELETDLRLPTKASRANQFLFFDADGKPSTDSNVTAKPVSDFMQGVITQETAHAAKVALDVEELARYTVAARNDDYTITDTDLIDVLEVTCGDQDRTITLPTLADNQGRVLVIKKMDEWGHNVIIQAEGTETIDGESWHKLFFQYDSISLYGGLSEWEIYSPKKKNRVTELLGINLAQIWLVRMEDGSCRFNCGGTSSKFGNLDKKLGSNGVHDKIIHNQFYPLIPSKSGTKIKQVQVAGGLAVVLFEDGELWNTGEGGAGQQADGTYDDKYYFIKSAENVNRFWLQHNSNDFSKGYWFHEKNDHTIWAVGQGTNGQLGLGDSLSKTSWTQVSFFDDKEVIELYLSGGNNAGTFAETVDGNIYYTGYNAYGQAGTGDIIDLANFTDVTAAWGGLTTGAAGRIVYLIRGNGYTIIPTHYRESWYGMLREDGLVRMCGNNSHGELGDGTLVEKHSPVIVSLAESIVELKSAGGPLGSIFARSVTNRIYRWGYNVNRNLGDGTTVNRSTPYNSGDPDNIDNNCDLILLDSGPYAYSPLFSNQYLRDSRDGSIWGSGHGLNYMVADGSALTTDSDFKQLAFEPGVKIIQARMFGGDEIERFVLFLDDNGRVWFVGDNLINQASLIGGLNTETYTVPMLMDIK